MDEPPANEFMSILLNNKPVNFTVTSAVPDYEVKPFARKDNKSTDMKLTSPAGGSLNDISQPNVKETEHNDFGLFPADRLITQALLSPTCCHQRNRFKHLPLQTTHDASSPAASALLYDHDNAAFIVPCPVTGNTLFQRGHRYSVSVWDAGKPLTRRSRFICNELATGASSVPTEHKIDPVNNTFTERNPLPTQLISSHDPTAIRTRMKVLARQQAEMGLHRSSYISSEKSSGRIESAQANETVVHQRLKHSLSSKRSSIKRRRSAPDVAAPYAMDEEESALHGKPCPTTVLQLLLARNSVHDAASIQRVIQSGALDQEDLTALEHEADMMNSL